MHGGSAPRAAVRAASHLFKAEVVRGPVQFVRYVFVSTASFVLDFMVLVLLTAVVGLHYLISAAFGFCLGLTSNYAMAVRWVFTGPDRGRLQFGLYFLTGLGGLAVNETVLFLFTEFLAFHYTVSKLVGAVFVLVATFFARRAILGGRARAHAPTDCFESGGPPARPQREVCDP